MQLARLRLEHFRTFAGLEFQPHPGRNLVLGGNGAGKTSLLEAIHLLAYGRSFRGGAHEALLRRGADGFSVFGLWRRADGAERRTGLAREGREWQARLDGSPVASLAAIHEACAVVCFEPGSHALLEGSGEPRRRFLDWGLFHVEPGFLPVWRRYQRALRQRNALLKQGPAPGELRPWEQELSDAGVELDRLRSAYLAALEPGFSALAAQLLGELGPAALHHGQGWPADIPLADALEQARPRDLRLGFTSVGPHRGDWRARYAGMAGIQTLSRGQEKLTALAALLAQAEHMATRAGDWPVILLDDLGSELDRAHQAAVWRWLRSRPAQVLVTGTEAPAAEVGAAVDAVFHVEQGNVQATG